MTPHLRWQRSTVDADLSYPAPPWSLSGSLWLTFFRLARPADARHPAGLYGAAFVRYDEPSPLTYGELLVARPARTPRGRRVTVTDIWVDSPASVAGGRELWAIPKELAELDREAAYGATAWTARADGRPVAAAHFRDLPRPGPRIPFHAGLWHPGLPDTGGEDRTASMRGRAGLAPTRARWTFAPDGPLGWLRGARQLASARLAGFTLDFG